MCLFKQCGDVFEIHIISHLQNFILLKTTVSKKKKYCELDILISIKK